MGNMKTTDAKKEIIRLFDAGNYEDGINFWKNILNENKSIAVSQHVFNNVIFKIGIGDWNTIGGKFERLYSIVCMMLSNGLFTMLNNCNFMTDNKKSFDCLRYIGVSIIKNEDEVNFNRFIKDIFISYPYDKVKKIIEHCFFQTGYELVIFHNFTNLKFILNNKGIKIIKNNLIESGLLNDEDKVLFNLKLNNLIKVNDTTNEEILNIIEEYWENEEIKIESLKSMLWKDFIKNQSNIIRIFYMDSSLISSMHRVNYLNYNKLSILLFDDRIRHQVLDTIFLQNDNLFVRSVIKFIHECFKIKLTNGSIERWSSEEDYYEELKEIVLTYGSNGSDIIETTISEMFNYKSKEILKFFSIKELGSIGGNDGLINFSDENNKQFFNEYLKYKVEDLNNYIEAEEQYHNYIAKVSPYVDESYDKKRNLLYDTYEYFLKNKKLGGIIELIGGVFQNDYPLANELISEVISNGSDDRFHITSLYYQPDQFPSTSYHYVEKIYNIFDLLNDYFEFANIYDLLKEKSIFKNKAFKNVIEYFEYILVFNFDKAASHLVYKEIFFLTTEVDNIFNLYKQHINTLYGEKHPYFYELNYISDHERFIGNRKKQIIDGFTNLYFYLQQNNFQYIDNFKESIQNCFNVHL